MDRAKILVVEDEAVVAMDIQTKLENLGYSVIASIRSGEEAVQIACEMRPDLILMDIHLQGAMDGISAAACIQASSPIPVAYMTAHGDQETFYRAKMTEPLAYIIKPFDEQELQATIEAALNMHHLVVLREDAEREYAIAVETAVQLGQKQRELAALNTTFQKQLAASEEESRNSQALLKCVKDIVIQIQQSLDELDNRLRDEPLQIASLPIDNLTFDLPNADTHPSS